MIRIVKMTFNPEKVTEFLANFEKVKNHTKKDWLLPLEIMELSLNI